MTIGAQKFRALLAKGGLIVAPGVYDGYSARLVEAAGFEMAATTGAGISNSLLGIDDIGVMGLSENVNHCRMLARTLSIPLTADADTGYGNPMNVHYTVQMFEEAGACRHQYRGPGASQALRPHAGQGGDPAGRG